jgi:diketogulonate reductase-like aldo/keto reductase
MSLNINSKVKLNNDVEIPIFGLGTWEISEE